MPVIKLTQNKFASPIRLGSQPINPPFILVVKTENPQLTNGIAFKRRFQELLGCILPTTRFRSIPMNPRKSCSTWQLTKGVKFN